MFAVTAVVVLGGRKRDLPTFYLDERVQGILSEESARKIAEGVLDPFCMYDSVTVTAVKVSEV